MAGYVVDEQLDALCDGFFDNIEDFLNFSPDDEVLAMVDSTGSKDGGGGDTSQITAADVGSQAFLSSNSDDNKICDNINFSEDWVSKFLDDSYLDIDFAFSATTTTFIDKDESQFRSPSPISVLKPNYLNFSGKGGSSSSPSPCSSFSSSSDTVSPGHVEPTTTLVPARARSKRTRRAAPVSSTMVVPILPPSSDGPPAIPTLLPECESFGESFPPPMKKKKNHAMEMITRRCLHCGLQKTPQWRGGPMGPKTLCNACGVRYKSGRLFPEYRPAASPSFVPAVHSNSHKKVVEMRIKACQKKVESGMSLPQYPAAKNCELLAYIK